MLTRMTTEERARILSMINAGTPIRQFNWIRYLTTIFGSVNIIVSPNDAMVVYAPEFLKRMVDLVLVTDSRTLANYLIWRIMINRVTNLLDKYRELRKEYHKAIYGSKPERSRWRECISYVNDNMGNAVGRLFVSKHLDGDAKNNALKMIKDIRQAMNELLSEVEWMDEKTKQLAMEKNDAMAVKIGYPQYILNDTALDNEYKHVNFQAETYFDNVLEVIRGIAITNLQMINQPVDKSLWSTTPAVVNAFYSAAKNQINFTWVSVLSSMSASIHPHFTCIWLQSIQTTLKSSSHDLSMILKQTYSYDSLE